MSRSERPRPAYAAVAEGTSVAEVLAALGDELERLSNVSNALQEAIAASRVVPQNAAAARDLQGADLLSQSLVALSAAAHGLADLPACQALGGTFDANRLMESVPLESVAARLADRSAAPSSTQGDIDLF